MKSKKRFSALLMAALTLMVAGAAVFAQRHFMLANASRPDVKMQLSSAVERESGLVPPEKSNGDPNLQNIDPLERVFHNLDFKVGSITSSPGTTGLIATFEYSNDGGATWTYPPVGGGGGAPAGYDRNVTNLPWTFNGNLSPASPNHTGSVSLTAQIR